MAGRNVSKYWISPAYEGLGLLSADLTNQNFPPHVHDSLVVAVTERGSACVKGRGDKFLAEPGAALVFNPEESHSATIGSDMRWTYRAFYFRSSALERLQHTLQTSSRIYFTENAFDDRELTGALLSAHRSLENNTDRFAIEEGLAYAMGLLYSRHGEARPHLPPGSGNQPIVDKIIGLLEDRYSEPLHLDALSDEVGLTHFQLIGLFKSVTGVTPYSMLTQIRLRRACRLLAGGTHISEVALDTGFYDQSALTNHFKRRFAITPAQFVRGRVRMAASGL